MIEINASRLDYLLERFGLDKESLAKEAKVKPQDITNPMALATLKKISKVFGKEPSFLTDPNPPPPTRKYKKIWNPYIDGYILREI